MLDLSNKPLKYEFTDKGGLKCNICLYFNILLISGTYFRISASVLRIAWFLSFMLLSNF